MPDESGGIPDTLQEVLDRDISVTGAFTGGMAAVVLAGFGAGVLVIETLGAGVANVVARLESVGRFIQAFFDEPIAIIVAGVEDTAAWIVMTDLGPFGFAVGVIAIAIGFWGWAALGAPLPFFGRFLDRFRTRN